ncbi:MAG TPA: thioesterase family protein [Steroidobacteraceae bacterium]|nr:thioesterase family protein [Steroidobacteraceae bacterium]
MSGAALYRTPIHGDWIDYNGHLRDAYYGLIVSLATDELMDRLGIDASYRQSSGNTLYTLELHMHFLREVKQSDIVQVTVRILGSDTKRIHAALDLNCEGRSEPAATAEIMLLHVHQGDAPAAQPFPAPIAAALAKFALTHGALAPGIPGSRRMELRSRS